MTFWVGLLIGVLITVACSKLARREKRMAWVRQHTDVLMTRLSRLLYIYRSMNGVEFSSVLEQLEEATKEFAESVEDLSVSMKEVL